MSYIDLARKLVKYPLLVQINTDMRHLHKFYSDHAKLQEELPDITDVMVIHDEENLEGIRDLASRSLALALNVANEGDYWDDVTSELHITGIVIKPFRDGTRPKSIFIDITIACTERAANHKTTAKAVEMLHNLRQIGM